MHFLLFLYKSYDIYSSLGLRFFHQCRTSAIKQWLNHYCSRSCRLLSWRNGRRSSKVFFIGKLARIQEYASTSLLAIDCPFEGRKLVKMMFTSGRKLPAILEASVDYLFEWSALNNSVCFFANQPSCLTGARWLVNYGLKIDDHKRCRLPFHSGQTLVGPTRWIWAARFFQYPASIQSRKCSNRKQSHSPFERL